MFHPSLGSAAGDITSDELKTCLKPRAWKDFPFPLGLAWLESFCEKLDYIRYILRYLVVTHVIFWLWEPLSCHLGRAGTGSVAAGAPPAEILARVCVTVSKLSSLSLVS